MTFDILLRGGTVVDGSGAPGTGADVAVRDGRIVEVGAFPDAQAAEVIDVMGKVVAPGFIDVHSHSDWILPIPGHGNVLAPLVRQGITTVVAGNCGFSPAPITSLNASLLELGSDMLRDGDLDYDWATLGEFLDFLDSHGVAFNIAQLVGHGVIRSAVMGPDTRRPTDEEMEAMKDIARVSLEQGAIGVSTGLGYAPGIFSENEELIEFARVVKEYDALLTSHLKSYSWISPAGEISTVSDATNVKALRNMLGIARQAGVPLQISHLIFVGERTWATADTALDEVERARADGLDVAFDAFPYTGGNTTIMVLYPAWALPNLLNNLRDPETRTRLREQLMLGMDLMQFTWDDVMILWAANPAKSHIEARMVSEIAADEGKDGFDTYFDLTIESRGRARVMLFQYSGNDRDETALRTVLAHPLNSFETDTILASKGKHNPASFGTFPRILGRYTRELKLMSLEEAVRKMTSLSAERAGLRERGLVRKGYWADITVFDPDSIADRATFREADLPSEGIEYVLINGQVVVRQGSYDSQKLAGKVLRRGA